MEAGNNTERQGCTLFKRREILVPTFRGWLFLLLMSAGLIFVAIREIHSFLAPIDLVIGDALVVEGWIPDYAYDKVVAEFNKRRFDSLYVTGGPIGKNEICSEYITYAERGAAILRSKGIFSKAVQAVPAPETDRDRTYASAVALKRWLLVQRIPIKSYHVMTLGAHARRTRLVFEKALGAGATVSVTAIDDKSYDRKHWWNASAGVRTVIGETIAYGYARFFFQQAEP